MAEAWQELTMEQRGPGQYGEQDRKHIVHHRKDLLRRMWLEEFFRIPNTHFRMPNTVNQTALIKKPLETLV